MKKYRFLLLLGAYLGVTIAHASFYEHARRLQSDARILTQRTFPDIVPGFKGNATLETTFNDHQALDAAKERAFAINDTAALLKQSAETRTYFRLNWTQILC